jgi:hypothetical protein
MIPKERLNKGWRMENGIEILSARVRVGDWAPSLGVFDLPVQRTSAVRALYSPWRRGR